MIKNLAHPNTFYYICAMKDFESVKVSKQTVQKLRAHKLESGVSITVFVEKAVAEKFEREKK